MFGEYLDGTISDAERERMDSWLEGHEQAPSAFSDPEEEQRVYRELRERIRQGREVPVRRLWRPVVLWRAACLAGMALAAGILVYRYQDHGNGKIPDATVAAYQVISTGRGQVKKIMLEDSTDVWLNAATTIRVATVKNKSDRIVFLDSGEAFFRVKHDASRPFSVVSGDLVTRDIGTSFDIRAYDLATAYRVSVSTGKVDVGRKDPSGKIHIISAGVLPGQVLLYNSISNKTLLTKKDADNISAWRGGNNVDIDGLTLSGIGEELSRHYNIQVTVSQPKLDPGRYSFVLAGLSLQEALQRLTLVTGASYGLDQNHLTINPEDKR